MPKTKTQKQYLIAAIILIVILSLVSLWHRPRFRYIDTTDYTKTQTSQLDAAAYLKYLENLKVDPKASKQLFEQLFTEEDIKKEVETALKTNQPIRSPQIPENDIKSVNQSGQQSVVKYLASITGLTLDFNSKIKEANKALFSKDLESDEAILDEYNNTLKKITNVEVPKEILSLHKDLLVSFLSYGRLLETSKSYANGSNEDPWPDVYNEYAVVTEKMKAYQAELEKISDKYKLSSITITPSYVEEQQSEQNKFALVKTVHAFLGVGDVTITVGDIPRIIMDAVQEGLTTAFGQFMGGFLQKMIVKIEQNYLIANFLYYSDALVSGQYVNDYLNKYVDSSLDRKIIKKFIPQFNCGKQNEDLRPVFKAKAQEYLGFEPEDIDPKDPQYFQKMAKVGSFMASENGWRLYYEDVAQQAKSEAEKAAEKELTSSGLKTPRNTMEGAINLSISSLVSAQQANLNAIMQLGISNAKSFIGRFVAQLTQTLVTQFVFRGATVSGGTVGVFKEQSTCLAAAQLQPIIPVSISTYQEPAAPPTQEELLEEECSMLPRG